MTRAEAMKALEDAARKTMREIGATQGLIDILAKLDALPPEEKGGWQPIATANKSEETELIDVWMIFTYEGEVRNQRRIPNVFWDGTVWVGDDDGDVLEWRDTIGQEAKITHWRPLPPAPSSETRGQR